MPRNYSYAYQDIKRQLSEIQKTLGYFLKEHNITYAENVLLKIQQYTLGENISNTTTTSLKKLNELLLNLERDSPHEFQDIRIFQILKLQLERLRTPDLENFIRDIESDLPALEERAEHSLSDSDIFYQQEYSEEYGTIMRPYQLIDGTMHPCRIDENGHATLLGDDDS